VLGRSLRVLLGLEAPDRGLWLAVPGSDCLRLLVDASAAAALPVSAALALPTAPRLARLLWALLALPGPSFRSAPAPDLVSLSVGILLRCVTACDDAMEGMLMERGMLLMWLEDGAEELNPDVRLVLESCI
jgi:hypothetical protein